MASDATGIVTGTYTVGLERINPAVGPVALVFGQTLSSGIDSVLEVDSYSFTAVAGDEILVRMVATGDTLNPRFRVFDANGQAVCSANDRRGTFFNPLLERQCSADVTGTYSIIVDDAEGLEVGTYSLVAQKIG